jgi:hypothetical protein
LSGWLRAVHAVMRANERTNERPTLNPCAPHPTAQDGWLSGFRIIIDLTSNT